MAVSPMMWAGRRGNGGMGRAKSGTHLFDLLPLLPNDGVRRFHPHGSDGFAEGQVGQAGARRFAPALLVLEEKLRLVLVDVPADLVGQLLEGFLRLPQSPLVVLADLGQVVRRFSRRASPIVATPAAAATTATTPRSWRRRSARVPLGGRQGRRRRLWLLEGGRVEEDAAEELGRVGQEEDGPEAERDEGAEHQEQHELLRQAEGAAGAGPFPPCRAPQGTPA